jgi:tripartite-type tricarboxylate transporter receptor subunit TctC
MLTRSVATILMLTSMLPAAVHADGVADFYRGRAINLVVGYGPGGGYDLCARLVARHIGRYIPGSPTVVVPAISAARDRWQSIKRPAASCSFQRSTAPFAS